MNSSASTLAEARNIGPVSERVQSGDAPRLAPLGESEIFVRAVPAVLGQAAQTRSAPRSRYRIDAEVAVAFAGHWDSPERRGLVAYEMSAPARHGRRRSPADGRDQELRAELQEPELHEPELHDQPAAAELVVRAVCFCPSAGGNLLAGSSAIEAEIGNVIPEGVMSIHV